MTIVFNEIDSAYASVGDLVRQNIAGQNAASHALHDLGGIADQDLLHTRLKAVLLTGEPERLRAFMRTLQKRLEQAGVSA